jgi:hypothetical protein
VGFGGVATVVSAASSNFGLLARATAVEPRASTLVDLGLRPLPYKRRSYHARDVVHPVRSATITPSGPSPPGGVDGCRASPHRCPTSAGSVCLRRSTAHEAVSPAARAGSPVRWLRLACLPAWPEARPGARLCSCLSGLECLGSGRARRARRALGRLACSWAHAGV